MDSDSAKSQLNFFQDDFGGGFKDEQLKILEKANEKLFSNKNETSSVMPKTESRNMKDDKSS